MAHHSGDNIVEETCIASVSRQKCDKVGIGGDELAREWNLQMKGNLFLL